MINGHEVTFVVAVDSKMGMGKDNTLPWRLANELKYFHERTSELQDESKQNAVIMGRNTWESIPEKRRPLPGRKNIILTRDAAYDAPDAFVATSLDEAFAMIDDAIETVHIIGGGRVFAEALEREELDTLYITEIDGDFACDVFFPPIPAAFSVKEPVGEGEDGGTSYTFYKYTRG